MDIEFTKILHNKNPKHEKKKNHYIIFCIYSKNSGKLHLYILLDEFSFSK